MSEYWKSVPRKFCDFCKCWITDNKPSVDFHERGKRHQENVQLRLKEIRKKSHKQSLEDEEAARQMEKIEKAALAAFKKDLKNDPQLAAQYGVSLEPKPKVENPPESEESGTAVEKSEKGKTKVKEWYEAKSTEGYTYYWSVHTGESKWEAPEEFVSLADQEEQEKEEEKKKEEEAAKEQEVLNSTPRNDLPSSRSAFGSWSVVKQESQPVVYDESSKAPALEDIPLPEVAPESKPQKEKFREKTVTSLGTPSSGNVTFKKRKIASGARNVRQRDNDD